MNLQQLGSILSAIELTDGGSYEFSALEEGEHLFLRYREYAQDSFKQVPQWLWQSGRRWYVSRHATESEVVQTALLAVLQFREHEVREHFRYNGARCFGPHIAVEALCSVAGKRDLREPPPRPYSWA